MYYQSAVILFLLNVYCYASPIPSVDQNKQTAFLANLMQERANPENSIIVKPNDEGELEKAHQYEYLSMLCELYGRCNDEEEFLDYDHTKKKRLSSGLFHGIPKFGKRAFSSAFAGIPKFG